MGRKPTFPKLGGAGREIKPPKCGGQGEVAWDQAEASRLWQFCVLFGAGWMAEMGDRDRWVLELQCHHCH